MRIAVALGSGGARGFVHIGVLEALIARGHEVTAVSGTSAGALVGGMFAAGRLPEFSSWVRGLSQRDVLRMLDFAWGTAGLVRANRLVDKFAEIVGPVQIEDLEIPFTAVATDLTAQREIWFERGPLAAAIRASIAIPGVFAPVVYNGHVLVDGGVLNPVPLEALASWSADRTLAVQLNGRTGAVRTGDPEETTQDDDPGWFSRRLRRLPGFGGGSDEDAERPQLSEFGWSELPRGLRTLDVTSMALNTSQALVARFRTAANPPDIWVTVPVDSAGTLEFARAAEMADLGRRLADRALDKAGL